MCGVLSKGVSQAGVTQTPSGRGNAAAATYDYWFRKASIAPNLCSAASRPVL